MAVTLEERCRKALQLQMGKAEACGLWVMRRLRSVDAKGLLASGRVTVP